MRMSRSGEKALEARQRRTADRTPATPNYTLTYIDGVLNP